MALLQPNLDPTRRQLRQFGLLLLPGLLGLVGGLVLYGGGSLATGFSIWGAALVVSGLGLLSPKFLLGVYLAWMYLVLPIGWAISHLVMGATFYLVVTPIGALSALTQRDALRRKRAAGAESYWTPSASQDEVRTYLRQF